MKLYSIVEGFNSANKTTYWSVSADEHLIGEYPELRDAVAAVIRFKAEDAEPMSGAPRL